jgi:hypothetical protein
MSEQNAVVRFFGYVLMAVGGLIGLLSGGCTVVFVGAMLLGAVQTMRFSELFSMAPMALIFGGIPFAIGAGLFLAGRKLAGGAARP